MPTQSGNICIFNFLVCTWEQRRERVKASMEMALLTL